MTQRIHGPLPRTRLGSREISIGQFCALSLGARQGCGEKVVLKAPPAIIDYCLAAIGWGQNMLCIIALHTRDAIDSTRRSLMTGNCEIWLAALSLGAFLCSSSVAQTTNTPVQKRPANMTELAVEYLAARNAKDLPRLKSLLHPKSLECITAENKDFYDARTTLLPKLCTN